MRFFDRYTGFWRRLKPLYVLYNVKQYRHLKPLKALFKQYGIKRSVVLPLHSGHFKKLPEVRLDDHWEEEGYVVLRNVFTEQEVNDLNSDMAEALDKGSIQFNYTGRKIHFAYEKVERIKRFMHEPKLIAALEQRMGGAVVPFQSINFQYGSEQKAHSDSIHMSTYPLGGLTAAWIALDDVDEQNGTLFYYPGSHKWPYATNQMIGASTSWMLSPNPNALYEEYIQNEIERRQAKPQLFQAKKGDVLLWHANLLHGGLLHKDMERTRRSLVIHYFKKDVICYHEISQRPAVVKPIG